MGEVGEEEEVGELGEEEEEATGSFFLTASLCTAARAPSGTFTHRLEEVQGEVELVQGEGEVQVEVGESEAMEVVVEVKEVESKAPRWKPRHTRVGLVAHAGSRLEGEARRPEEARRPC